jgi:hypothetical protein
MADEETERALADLRIGMPHEVLARILGEDKVACARENDGHVSFEVHAPSALGPNIPFTARLDVDGKIASLGYFRDFKAPITAVGLAIGVPVADVFSLLPDFQSDADESAPDYGIEAWRASLGDGNEAVAKIRDGALLAFQIERAGAVYPGAMPPEVTQVHAGLRAYDLEILPRTADPADNQGWVFGLPPGIRPDQWPLDPVSGYPLMHGFTLLLPEEYRVHGPEIVALSFFATAQDQNDGGACVRDALHAAVTGQLGVESASTDLEPFRRHAATAHPRLHRMQDILDYEYAVILLTEVEFTGDPCSPPELGPNPWLDEGTRPEWLKVGGGYACFHGNGGIGMDGKPSADSIIARLLGGIPDQRLDWQRAIAITPRAIDPNAGIPPAEVYGGPSPLGYQPPFDPFDDYNERDWAKGHKPNHLGGTMRPAQGTPSFSPYYIGFEEYFGGYNFGTGNAQLDFLQMKIDWAC